MKPEPTIDARAAIRLRDEYRRRSVQLTIKAKVADGNSRAFIEKESAVLFACAQDLDDLITGKEHPSGRRS